METGRGKKGKKWHLTLGLKDAIFAGIGIVGLMMMSFTVGTLAGRGDIYRAAYSWGLLAPEGKPAAQIMPQLALTPAPPTSAAPTAAPAATPAAAPASTIPPLAAAPAAGDSHTTSAAAKTAHPAPVTGSIAPVPPPASASSSRKRSKNTRAQEQKAREDQLRRERQAVARKLTFLNSFDSTPKSAHKKDREKAKATAAKPQPAQVKVATYRDSNTAKAKMAEMQKHGVKVSLKQGKDAKGAYYILYRQAPAPHPKESEKVAQKKEKTEKSNASRKPRIE